MSVVTENIMIHSSTTADVEIAVPLVAQFRVELSGYKGEKAQADEKSARAEFNEYISAGYPIYLAFIGSTCVGYIVCKVEKPTVWVESLFVKCDFRRRGIASALFGKAEDLARSFGEDGVFNFVHPNNGAVINFLRSKGYTILNLIEVRKPWTGEKINGTIAVGDFEFDY